MEKFVGSDTSCYVGCSSAGMYFIWYNFLSSLHPSPSRFLSETLQAPPTLSFDQHRPLQATSNKLICTCCDCVYPLFFWC